MLVVNKYSIGFMLLVMLVLGGIYISKKQREATQDWSKTSSQRFIDWLSDEYKIIIDLDEKTIKSSKNKTVK